MSVLINFIGSPGVGKTSISASLFSELKRLEKNVEFVPEFVKQWVYEDKPVGDFGQYCIFGTEAYNQSLLFNKTDYIIADSPVLLTAFYQQYYTKKDTLLRPSKDFYEVATGKYGVKVYNFFLERKKKYNQKGRYQTEQQSDEMSPTLKNWLIEQEYEFEQLDCKSSERLKNVLDILQIEQNLRGEDYARN